MLILSFAKTEGFNTIMVMVIVNLDVIKNKVNCNNYLFVHVPLTYLLLCMFH